MPAAEETTQPGEKKRQANHERRTGGHAEQDIVAIAGADLYRLIPVQLGDVAVPSADYADGDHHTQAEHVADQHAGEAQAGE